MSTTSGDPFTSLLENADRSARLCECEGRSGITHRPLNRCEDCGASACEKCGGRPEHNFKLMSFVSNPRLTPTEFSKQLKSALPMSFTLSGIDNDSSIDKFQSSLTSPQAPPKMWAQWRAAVVAASKNELHFVALKRQDNWIAVYRSATATLELLLHPLGSEWRLFGVPRASEPANSEVRVLLASPIARLVCNGGLFDGVWELALPDPQSFKIEIQGGGELVPSWEAKLGLQEPRFKNKVVWSQLTITVPPENLAYLDRDISGIYTLLDKCGAPNSSLHKRIDKTEGHPLFLFLDPTRCGDNSDDGFVFSWSKRRYEYGETRPIVCRLDNEWRQNDVRDVQMVTTNVSCKWVKAPEMQMKVRYAVYRLRFTCNSRSWTQPTQSGDTFFAVPSEDMQVAISHTACSSANAMLVCKVPLGPDPGPTWSRGHWSEVDSVHARTTFQALAWLIERIRNIDDHFDSWISVELAAGKNHANCERCAPAPPALKWVKTDKKVVALEDSQQAGAYEQALKHRPSAFVTQLKVDEAGVGTVRIGINIASLVHRALSRLPSVNRPEKPLLSWRLTTEFTPMAKLPARRFELLSNRGDIEHEQPPHFRIPLRPEQLRSLGWMLKQESVGAPPF
ncbi:MAG TPA: hypothetical protein V6C72_18355, partial [Chroococcales cyanobacterium]